MMLHAVGHVIVCDMTRLPDRSRPVVLSVRDLREEVQAGLGRAALCVRTLDGVSLTVHSGELIVLRGGVASGAASLLNALAGVTRHRSGVRVPARGLRVRRACIAARAFAAIEAAWRDVLPFPSEASGPQALQPPLVYVFRVRAADTVDTSRACVGLTDPAVWRAWALALRAGGGSVVAHVMNDPAAVRHRSDQARRESAGPVPSVRVGTRYGDDGGRSTAVHEPLAGGVPTASGREQQTGGVRTITLAAGRIVSADPAMRPWSSP